MRSPSRRSHRRGNLDRSGLSTRTAFVCSASRGPSSSRTGRRTTRADLIPPCSPLNSSTRAVKALGSKSVAGLPVMARCVPLTDPPVCAEPLSPINQICHQFHQTPKDHPNTDDARLPSFSCSPTKLVAGSRRAATTTASALPLAELAAVGPEIAETAVTCFAITLVGLAIGFVLLRVEAAVEGEE